MSDGYLHPGTTTTDTDPADEWYEVNHGPCADCGEDRIEDPKGEHCACLDETGSLVTP